ncbi:FMN-linked oxidoreductase [Daedalea quercina L-15889]|uniref:FMN-linked oxidoreductase n=1 Tax=Daedalea quercina L-15889 TaxID=1314783 RepID=A0A165TFX3_9APHY|nr:FMN-linked oxidoreductase [Daedalea quercina L-15889]
MSRRSHSPPDPSSSRLAKRPRLDFEPLTPDDYKDGLMLAPMVRSGALPTRLYSLKHGASLVWGPETVDKAILHTERVVDPVTGVVSYVGKTKPIFLTHPIEKPYLIYQIGSADPETAVQAAKMVMQDVAGFDLNCGCPKPFSTHAGMGAALLSNPDLLCSILTALRQAMPPEISVSAKIRLLPEQNDTLKLVERIINTGVNALTVHCRTRNQRKREPALIDRLREIVEFVEGMGRGVAVIENGDCEGFWDARRIREITGAHSCMIATAAEANPTCFSPTPLTDLEKTFIPAYIRLARYVNNHWSLTKYCSSMFIGDHVNGSRSDLKNVRAAIQQAKCYEDMEQITGTGTGEDEFRGIVEAIQKRGGRRVKVQILNGDSGPMSSKGFSDSATTEATTTATDVPTTSAGPEDAPSTAQSECSSKLTPEADGTRDRLQTPPTGPADPSLMNAPLAPANEMRMPLPAMITGELPTPTPTPRIG